MSRANTVFCMTLQEAFERAGMNGTRTRTWRLVRWYSVLD
jgi:hypothetical protein